MYDECSVGLLVQGCFGPFGVVFLFGRFGVVFHGLLVGGGVSCEVVEGRDESTGGVGDGVWKVWVAVAFCLVKSTICSLMWVVIYSDRVSESERKVLRRLENVEPKAVESTN